MSATTLQHVETFTRSRASLAPTLLRWGLGTVFLAHVYGKLTIFTIPGTVAFFETHGFPGWTVYPVIALELLGGIGLLLGFQTRLVALALLPVMAGALVPHLGNGWMFTNTGGGWEYVAFLIVALSAQALLGGGALSITREDVGSREGAG
jgi:putative oxidoreductase